MIDYLHVMFHRLVRSAGSLERRSRERGEGAIYLLGERRRRRLRGCDSFIGYEPHWDTCLVDLVSYVPAESEHVQVEAAVNIRPRDGNHQVDVALVPPRREYNRLFAACSLEFDDDPRVVRVPLPVGNSSQNVGIGRSASLNGWSNQEETFGPLSVVQRERGKFFAIQVDEQRHKSVPGITSAFN
jgi:hypothetical protein